MCVTRLIVQSPDKFQAMDRIRIRKRFAGAGLYGTLRRPNKLFPGTWLVAIERGQSIALEWRDDSAFEHVT